MSLHSLGGIRSAVCWQVFHSYLHDPSSDDTRHSTTKREDDGGRTCFSIFSFAKIESIDFSSIILSHCEVRSSCCPGSFLFFGAKVSLTLQQPDLIRRLHVADAFLKSNVFLCKTLRSCVYYTAPRVLT